MLPLAVLACSLILFSAEPQAGTLYEYKDENGVSVITDRPPANPKYQPKPVQTFKDSTPQERENWQREKAYDTYRNRAETAAQDREAAISAPAAAEAQARQERRRQAIELEKQGLQRTLDRQERDRTLNSKERAHVTEMTRERMDRLEKNPDGYLYQKELNASTPRPNQHPGR